MGMQDCVVGYRCYRTQFTVLTGWVHHSAYTILLWYICESACLCEEGSRGSC